MCYPDRWLDGWPWPGGMGLDSLCGSSGESVMLALATGNGILAVTLAFDDEWFRGRGLIVLRAFSSCRSYSFLDPG